MTNDGKTPMHVLVTGAAGFIGFQLASRLLEAGYRVTAFDNLNDYYDVALKKRRIAEIGAHPNFAFSVLDLTDAERVTSLFAATRPDAVVHLAAQAGVRYSLTNPRSYVASNVDGFLSVLEAARCTPPKHLIYASSSSVYGANTKVPFHEDDPVLAPVSLYAATKRSNELMAQTYAHLFGLRLSGLRFFTVYGPWGRPDMAYYSFTKAILEGRPIDVYNNGALKRDFTYVDDVVEAVVRLLPHAPAGEGAPHRIYNIGNHTPVALMDFIGTLEAALGQEARKTFLPMQPGDVPATFADVSRLQAVTGFQPKTTLAEGLRRFVTWYRSYHV